MFRLAAPVLAGVQMIALTVFVAPATLSLLRAERSVDMRTARLGDGIDELSVRLEPVIVTLGQHASGFSGLFVVAAVSTLIALVAVGAHVSRAIGGFGDMGAIIRHTGSHLRSFSAEAKGLWGVVRDAETDEPLPFARVSLTGAQGVHTIARTVSDAAGRYGFGALPEQAETGSLKISVRKSGYYFPSRKQASGDADVYMDSAGVSVRGGRFWTGRFARVLSGAAFWTSVASVPLISATLPHALAVLFAGSLIVAVCARVIGLGRAVQHSP